MRPLPLNSLLWEYTLAFFFLYPFVKATTPAIQPTQVVWQKPNIHSQLHRYKLWPKPNEPLVHLPKLNLWPWIPLIIPTPFPNQQPSQPKAVLPDHNLWPWIPQIIPTPLPNHHDSKSKARLPDHNLWPWIPLIIPTPLPNQHPSQSKTLLPDHNFWPWIPLNNSTDNKTENGTAISKLPTHNFWPFIPVSPNKNVSVKPTPAFHPTKKPFPSTPNRYNYGEIMYKSILFYEVQRSGWLPPDRKIKWRGNSALDDQGFDGEDLSGGWYDAGDYVKFGTPMAAATFTLLWGIVEYPEAYKTAGLFDDVLASVKWPLDYFIRAHVKKYELYGQLGDPYIDHTYWGRPEDMDMERPAYKLTPYQPGSDLVADTASAMALGYLAFKVVDPPFAKTLLEHAVELFEFADFYRGGYTDSIGNAWQFYRSYSDEDELAWAAIWLYRATFKAHYLNKAKHYYDRMDVCWAQNWADKSCSVPVLMYQMTKDDRYKAKVESMMSRWLPGGTISYTPKGLAYSDKWGTLRNTANMAFIALRAADLGIRPATYRTWARKQIHYMLGDSGRSYVVGYGHNPPTRPHHASSSCKPPPEPCTWEDYRKPEPNSHTLFGALVGGPDMRDHFHDSRSDYVHNEVGCEYNAGFQSSLAALRSLELRMPP